MCALTFGAVAVRAALNINHAHALQLGWRNSCSDSCSFRFHVFEFPRLDSNRIRRRLTQKRRCIARAPALSQKWNFFKKSIHINSLSPAFHHDCVLFVQHIPENGSNWAFVRRSVVACAELFMDVDRATEGGIPRSSR
jgi:hypothetical protein